MSQYHSCVSFVLGFCSELGVQVQMDDVESKCNTYPVHIYQSSPPICWSRRWGCMQDPLPPLFIKRIYISVWSTDTQIIQLNEICSTVIKASTHLGGRLPSQKAWQQWCCWAAAACLWGGSPTVQPPYTQITPVKTSKYINVSQKANLYFINISIISSSVGQTSHRGAGSSFISTFSVPTGNTNPYH